MITIKILLLIVQFFVVAATIAKNDEDITHSNRVFLIKLVVGFGIGLFLIFG